MYGMDELIPIDYTNFDFMLYKDLRKLTSRYVFTLGGGAMSWKSIRQKCSANSTTEAEYVAACEALKEAV